jgi:hypothetical protein
MTADQVRDLLWAVRPHLRSGFKESISGFSKKIADCRYGKMLHDLGAPKIMWFAKDT